MTERRFVEVATPDRPQVGAATVARISDVAIALFNVGGRILAINDHCIRCGASLASGVVAGTNVSCSSCGWRYDLATGRLTALPALRADTFEVRIVDSRLLVAAEPSVPELG
jgi:nitrite reductase/ring-hydroxylating ferredoxin subunit